MVNLKAKTVELLCAFATIIAPLSLFAQSPKSLLDEARSKVNLQRQLEQNDLSRGLENWRRQHAISSVAEQQGLIVLSKQVPRPSSQMSQGGPGFDGGGGVGVMTTQGQLRLLDLAIADRAQLVRFDKDTYRRILAAKGNFISNKGTFVPNEEFFSCGIVKLSRQDNIFLQFLTPENLRLTVALTDMPLNIESQHPFEVVFPSPFQSGYAWIASPQPGDILSSSTVPADYQRPIASYAVQRLGVGTATRQVLLVNSQMYHALSAKDKCALQVHELFRYIGNVGKLRPEGLALLLKRPLSTPEVEHLTRKVLAGQPVYIGEIPATNFFKYLAVNGSDSLPEGFIKQTERTLYSKDDDGPISLREAESLYWEQKRSMSYQEEQEEFMMKQGRSFFDLRINHSEQEKILSGQSFDVRDLSKL